MHFKDVPYHPYPVPQPRNRLTTFLHQQLIMGFGKDLLSFIDPARAYKKANHVRPYTGDETKATKLTSIKTKLTNKFRMERQTEGLVSTTKRDLFDDEQATSLDVPTQRTDISSSLQVSSLPSNSCQPSYHVSTDGIRAAEDGSSDHNQATSSDALSYPSTSYNNCVISDIIYPNIAELSATSRTPRTSSTVIDAEKIPQASSRAASHRTETAIHADIVTQEEPSQLHQRAEDFAAVQALSSETSGSEHFSQPDGSFSSVVVLLPKVNTIDTSIPSGHDCLPPRITTPFPEPPLALGNFLDDRLSIADGQDRIDVASQKSEPEVNPVFVRYCSAPLVALTAVRPSLNQQFEELFNRSESTTPNIPDAEPALSENTNDPPILPPPAETNSQQHSGSSLQKLQNELRRSKAEIECLQAHMLCSTLERWDALQDRSHAHYQISTLQHEVHRLNVQATFDTVLLDDGLFGPALQAVRNELRALRSKAEFDGVLIRDGLHSEKLQRLRDENSALRRRHEVDHGMLAGALYGEELEVFRQEVALCEEQLEDERAENEALRAEIRDLRARNEVLEESVAGYEDNVSRLIEEGNNVRGRAHALQTERDAALIRLAQAQARAQLCRLRCEESSAL